MGPLYMDLIFMDMDSNLGTSIITMDLITIVMKCIIIIIINKIIAIIIRV